MATVENPLLLLPHGEKKSNVYVCVSVEPALANRSEVIQGLMATTGVVDLPAGVSLELFRSWSGMTVDISTLSEQSADAVAAALQVADAMGDKATRTIASALAKKIQSTNWQNSASVEATQQLITSLPHHLQRLMLESLTMSPQQVALAWPLPLQLAYFGALISAPKVFTIGALDIDSTHPAFRAALSLLDRTASASPGLRHLRICTTEVAPGTAATLVADALTHHASFLKSLALPPLASAAAGPGMPPSALHILAAVPRLSLLSALILEHRHGDTAPDTEPTFAAAVLRGYAAAVAALPQLPDCRLCMPSLSALPASQNPDPSGKRRRVHSHSVENEPATAGDSCDGVLSLDPLIAALSTAPALTKLTLSVVRRGQQIELPCCGISGPFHRLQRLELQVSSQAGGPRGPASRVCVVESLPSLETLAYRNSKLVTARDVDDIFASARRQPCLRALDVAFVGGSNELLTGLRSQLAALACMRSMHSVRLDLAPTPPLLPGTVRAATAGLGTLAALDALHLILRGPGLDFSSDGSVMEEDGGWMSMLKLSRLTGLEYLCIEVSGLEAWVQWPQEALYALDFGTLTALTRLDVMGMEVESSRILGTGAGQLSSLTNLQRLQLEVFFVASASASCQACLGALTALRELELAIRPVSAHTVACLLRATAGMRQLEHVDVTAGTGFSREYEGGAAVVTAGWVEGLLALPEGPREVPVGFLFECLPESVQEGEYRAVWQVLARRGVEIAEWQAEMASTVFLRF